MGEYVLFKNIVHFVNKNPNISRHVILMGPITRGVIDQRLSCSKKIAFWVI